MDLLTTSLLSLNPEAEKLKLFNSNNITIEDNFIEEQEIDLKRTYYFTGIPKLNMSNLLNFAGTPNNDKSDVLKNFLLEFLYANDEDMKISSDVISMCYSTLDILYPSLIEELEIENIYNTPYGTIVFDWEKDIDNVFSLEIGSKALGYFIEKDGKDKKQIDSVVLELEQSKKELLQDLSSFLSI